MKIDIIVMNQERGVNKIPITVSSDNSVAVPPGSVCITISNGVNKTFEIDVPSESTLLIRPSHKSTASMRDGLVIDYSGAKMAV